MSKSEITLKDKNEDLYIDYKSDGQIHQIYQYGGVNTIARLNSLLSKHTNKKDFQKLLTNSDSEIFKALIPVVNSDLNSKPNLAYSSNSARDKAHAENMANVLKKQVDTSKLKNLLDIGGGDGGITMLFGKELGITDLHCVEVNKTSNDHVKYTYLDPLDSKFTLDYPDKSFDLITAFMSLHHIEFLDRMRDEIMRILKPGGILYIKEHDSRSVFDAMLVDIEHRIFIHKYNESILDPRLMHYKNTFNWIKYFSELTCIYSGYYITNKFGKLSNTRAWLAIFQKK